MRRTLEQRPRCAVTNHGSSGFEETRAQDMGVAKHAFLAERSAAVYVVGAAVPARVICDGGGETHGP